VHDGFLKAEPDARDLSGKIRDHEEIGLACARVIERTHEDHVLAAPGRPLSQQLGRRFASRIGRSRTKRSRLVDGPCGRCGRRVLVCRADQKDACVRACVPGRLQQSAGSDEILLVAKMRFAQGSRDTAECREMHDGLRCVLCQGLPNRDEIGDVDFPVCAMGVVAGPAKSSHEPSSHEPGRAGDKDPHGRRLPDRGSKGNDTLGSGAT